ncbi:MAG: VWA domain-containing protein [Actinomycetota bacterium]|jgi:Ca-activated chloride channel family protein|nr:VWA domain-containing protein [Actinomycetota bacterium]
MQLNTLLDLDIVAVEAEDEVSVLLELAAPQADSQRTRAPAALEIVLDRSGSMSGDRLEAAKGAIEALIDRLDPTDSFGLVVFDDEVQVAVPAGPLTDKEAVRRLVRGLDPGGMTNLSGGLMRGLQEVRRVSSKGSATVVLLSDGHANHGVTAAEALETIAAAGRARGVTTSTVGIGLDYDETLLAALSKGGAGNAHFAEEADAAGAAVASEVDGLLEQAAQACSLTVRPTGAVATVRLFNDLPVARIEGGFMVELGDFHSGEERKLLLTIDVPAMSALGLAEVCSLELQWVDAAKLDTHMVTIPVHVNVVPGDQAAGRIANPTVRTEVAFQSAQRAKREAAEALRRGDAAEAARLYEGAGLALRGLGPLAAPAMASEMEAEADLLSSLSLRASHDDPRRVAKFTEADRHRKARRRGGHDPKG